MLTRYRQVLVSRADALHAAREPWGISVYDAHSRLLGIPPPVASAQRLPAEALARLDGQAFRRAMADLESFISLGGLAIVAATSPWAAAFDADAITTPDAAQAALSAARTLAGHTLPRATGRLRQVLADCGQITLRHLTTDQALACAEHVWLSCILDAVSVTDGRVGAFDGQPHLRTVARFGVADRAHISTTAVRVRRSVAENATRVRDAYPRESEVVEHQARLKRGHLPVRQLFQAAPHVLGAPRPCWAMSPLVVSRLLPAQRCFDIVIFDEASLTRRLIRLACLSGVDGAGAIMRGNILAS